MHPITRPLTLACLLLSACANYDFAKARRPDGSMDYPKLIADLDASGEQSLYDFTWIPLLWLDLNTFERSEPNYPHGYTLLQVDSIGPVFCIGSMRSEVVDLQGAAIEREDFDWLGWGLLYHDLDQRIETTSGPRLFDRGRFALLFQWEHPLYLQGQAADSKPAERAEQPGAQRTGPTPGTVQRAGTVQ